MESVGFIGLGAMGLPMVENLDKKLPGDVSIFVNDIVEEQVESLVSKSKSKRIHALQTAKEVAEKSKVILTMLPEGEHVHEVYLNPKQGIIQADLSEKLIVDCSTIDIESSKEVASAISAQYPTAKFYDAPVSGGISGAIKGSLTFMVGIDESSDDSWKRIHEFLGMMGASIFACGGATTGLVTKLCNNYLSGTIAIASSEAMNMGIRMGLDPVRLSEIFATSTAQNAILDKFNPVPGVDPNALSTKGYKGGFKVQLMKKDYTLATQLAKSAGAKLVLGEAGLATYEGASNDPNCRDLDSRVVYRYLGGVENWHKNA